MFMTEGDATINSSSSRKASSRQGTLAAADTPLEDDEHFDDENSEGGEF